mmetsp:Transcript_21790/g.31196  ORF Transcript_21790/g.31196 Transcript_21790/m.31196 type:complete len:274 (+) Transcript_21790:335-1156(+)
MRCTPLIVIVISYRPGFSTVFYGCTFFLITNSLFMYRRIFQLRCNIRYCLLLIVGVIGFFHFSLIFARIFHGRSFPRFNYIIIISFDTTIIICYRNIFFLLFPIFSLFLLFVFNNIIIILSTIINSLITLQRLKSNTQILRFLLKCHNLPLSIQQSLQQLLLHTFLLHPNFFHLFQQIFHLQRRLHFILIIHQTQLLIFFPNTIQQFLLFSNLLLHLLLQHSMFVIHPSQPIHQFNLPSCPIIHHMTQILLHKSDQTTAILLDKCQLTFHHAE